MCIRDSHTGAHPVEAAGDLISAAAKLSAGVKDGEDHRHRGEAGLMLDPHGDAPAVIGDPDDIVREDLGLNMGAVALQRLVDGVIHDFVNQVVEPPRAGGADIHTRALAHRFQALQDLDLIFIVLLFHFMLMILQKRSSFLFMTYSVHHIHQFLSHWPPKPIYKPAPLRNLVRLRRVGEEMRLR